MVEPVVVEPVVVEPAASTGQTVVVQVALVARQVPRLLGRVVLGGLLGGFLGTLVGLATWGVLALLGWSSASGWTGVALGLISTLSFVVGGCYIGGLRGCAGGLVTIVDKLDLVPKVWALVRPYVLRYAAALRDGARATEARSTVLRSFREEQRGPGAQPGDNGGLAVRAERFIAGLLHAALAGGMLRALVGREETNWQDIEKHGVKRAAEALGDVISGLFHGPALVAMLLSALVAVLPHLVYSLLSGI